MRPFDFTIRTKQDVVDAVNRLGFLPYFENRIEGFSIEEHVGSEAWFDSAEGVWEWKGPLIRENAFAYGKFFDKKAVFMTKEWFLDYANYRRDGYDFDARFDDELASFKDKALFDLIDANAPVLSKNLKKLGNYRKDGNKGFDTLIVRLQEQGYVLISDFIYEKDRHGATYGWGVAQYSTPEHFFGEDFSANVYRRTPEESYERLFAHLKSLFPEEDEAVIRKFLK
ncbi:MAG: hypothetical protein IJ744_03710 [Lachnospiraceae bacterium]|nr:hypothetical protein [Lachnospiraceae bacterium]